MELQQIIDDYSPEYCAFLEAAYGNGMLAEGGEDALMQLFPEKNITGKKILDIGFGLGGAAMYLAEQHGAYVTGIEVNPWMVAEATRRLPIHLQNKVQFIEYNPQQPMPFSDETFDIIYSKGVLTHVNHKDYLFSEIYRVLTKDGIVTINDWLSPQQGLWGDRIQTLCKTEGLTLYAETEKHYYNLLKSSGFQSISIQDKNADYYRYNSDIVGKLKQFLNAKDPNPIFEKFSLPEAIDCYQLIADAINDNELLIRGILANKRK